MAAIIHRNGRLLICQRRDSDPLGLKWEFPGGKVEHGESLEAALRRELREELDVTATIGEEIYRTRHKYSEHDYEVEIVFFSADINRQDPRNLSFQQITWCEPECLVSYDFLPADLELIQLLASQKLRLTADRTNWDS